MCRSTDDHRVRKHGQKLTQHSRDFLTKGRFRGGAEWTCLQLPLHHSVCSEQRRITETWWDVTHNWSHGRGQIQVVWERQSGKKRERSLAVCRGAP